MIKRLVLIVLYSSLFISIGSAALVLRTYYILNKDADWLVILFVFFSTLFTYNISKIVPLWSFWKNEKNNDYAYNERNTWNVKHKYKLLYASIFSLAFILVFGIQFKVVQLVFLAHLGFISVIYSTPLFSGKSLRAIPFIKVFLIAYTWAAMSVLPIIENDFSKDLIYIFLGNFLFVLAITLPFDLRDFTRDKSQNVKTIPHVLGKKGSKLMAIIALLISLIISPTQYQCYDMFLTVPIILLILFSNEKRNEFYYLGLIDATLILRFLIVLI